DFLELFVNWLMRAVLGRQVPHAYPAWLGRLRLCQHNGREENHPTDDQRYDRFHHVLPSCTACFRGSSVSLFSPRAPDRALFRAAEATIRSGQTALKQSLQSQWFVFAGAPCSRNKTIFALCFESPATVPRNTGLF